MSSSHYASHGRNRQEEASEEEIIWTNVNIHQPHHQHTPKGKEGNVALLKGKWRWACQQITFSVGPLTIYYKRRKTLS